MGNHVKFDSKPYYNAIKRAVKSKMDLLAAEIFLSLTKHVSALNMREMDAKFKADFISSLRSKAIKMGETVIVSAKMGGGKQAFRAVYYEFGTGTKMDAPSGSIPYTGWNPARPSVAQAKIYQRPYGVWYDQGGNKHMSLTKGTPKPLSNKKGLRGEEVEPQHPFANSIRENLPKIDEYVLDAVKSVPLGAYIRIRSIRK